MTQNMIAIDKSNWFEHWFDSPLYHRLYNHRSEEEAQNFIENLLHEISPSPGSTMLDLGCGNGRHSKHLAAQQHLVTGIDLSSASIREAKKYESPTLHFCRHDMRASFGRACFDYVFSFFTSFGYFDDEEQNAIVMRNIANSLKPGGLLVLDYLNTEKAKRNLRAFEEREIDGIRYEIGKWYDARFIRKRIRVHVGLTEPLEFVEQIRSYTMDEIKRLAETQGLTTEQVFGNYHLERFDSEKSDRMIVFARKLG